MKTNIRKKNIEISDSITLTNEGIRIYSYIDFGKAEDQVGEEIIYPYSDLKHNLLESIIVCKQGTTLEKQIKEGDYTLDKNDGAVIATLEEIEKLKAFSDALLKEFTERMK